MKMDDKLWVFLGAFPIFAAFVVVTWVHNIPAMCGWGMAGIWFWNATQRVLK